MSFGLRPLLLAAIVALAAAPKALAQVGGTTDIITGKVTGPSREPIADATVEVVSVETQVTRDRATDAHGRFTILFPEGGGQYLLLVRYIGVTPLRLSVARQADEDRLVVNAQTRQGLASAREPLTPEQWAKLPEPVGAPDTRRRRAN